MAYKDIVVVGASMGGIEALQTLVRGLPEDFKGSVFIVLHTAPSSPNNLDRILGRAGPLPVRNARDWDPIELGQIYVAPADHHMLIERSGYVRLSRGPKENRFRPAIDPLFRSAARGYGRRVVGVVLTGFLDDGTAGLWSIKERAGMTVVQSPEEAIAPAMPLSALRHVEVDFCVRLKEMGPLLARLAVTAVDEKGEKPVSEDLETEVKIAQEDNAISSGILKWGEPSLFACPECHGVLMQLKEGANLRFRCHTGHAYSLETLLSEITESTESTLWNAVRSVEESILLMKRIAKQLQEHGHKPEAQAFQQKIQVAEEQIRLLRAAIMRKEKPAQAPGKQEPSKR